MCRTESSLRCCCSAAAARLNAAMRQSVDERRRPMGPTWTWNREGEGDRRRGEWQAKGIGYNAWWRFDCGSAGYALVVSVVAAVVVVAVGKRKQ